jgi:RNA polymerase sigma factor for flagellar operon FliA
MASLADPPLAAPIPATYRPVETPERLVATHVGLVRRIAWQVHGRARNVIEVDDLVQIGMVALIEASRAFVQRGEAAFATYATVRVRGAMLDELRRLATVNRGALQTRKRLAAARATVEAETKGPATDEAVAATLGLTLAGYAAAVDAAQGLRYESLDEIYSDHAVWFTDNSPDAFDALAASRMKAALAAAVAHLPEREALVLQLYFVEELNLDEIGLALGVGAARVCQIKKAALDKLRTVMGDWQAE